MARYDFKMLSWTDFEELCCDLLASELACHIESFKAGRDGGIDLRYALAGTETVVQCKHYAESGFSSLYQTLKKEKKKLSKLNPKSYRLLTSVPLNPAQKKKLFDLLKPHVKSASQIWGAGDLNRALTRNRNVEKNHFKLWLTSTNVLKTILHRKTYQATDFNVLKIKEEIKLYVDNDSFATALGILEEKRALIISGPPGVGKTTLADMLMYHYIGKKFEPIYITGKVDEIYDTIDPTERQVIVFDDFLGAFRLEPSRMGVVDRRVQDLLDFVGKSKKTRFILTTREHILKQAQDFSEHLAHKKIDYLKYILDVGLYTRYVKGKILYNHIRYSDLPEEYVDEILKDGFYKKVIDHPGFNPRIISWLGEKEFYTNISSSIFQKKITDVLKNPTELWRIIYRSHFSEWAQSLLIVTSTLHDADVEWLQICFKPIHVALSKKLNFPRKVNDFHRAVAEVENTFLRISPHSYKASSLEFLNPSLREFIEKEWWENEDLREVVLENLSCISQISTIVSILGFSRSKFENPSIARPLRKSLIRVVDNIHSQKGKSNGSVIRFSDYLVNYFSNVITQDELIASLEKLMPHIEALALRDNTEAEKLSEVFMFFYYESEAGNEAYLPIAEKFKLLMWAVADAWKLIEIYTNYLNTMEEYGACFTSTEISNFRDACLQYIEDAKEDYDGRGADELAEYKDNFSDLLKTLSVTDKKYITRLDEHIFELEIKMADNQDYEESSFNVSVEEGTEMDNHLESLFSSIKD